MIFDYEDLIISTTKPYVKAEMWWKPNQKVVPAKYSLYRVRFIRKNYIKIKSYINNS